MRSVAHPHAVPPGRPRPRAPGRALLVMALVMLLMHAGTPSASDSSMRIVTVFATASLSGAFGELGRTLERRRPGLRVRFSFGDTQQLVSRLELGARPDLLAAADARTMQHAAALGRLGARPIAFARNGLGQRDGGYSMAVLRDAAEADGARAFEELVMSAAGRRVLARFRLVPAATPATR